MTNEYAIYRVIESGQEGWAPASFIGENGIDQIGRSVVVLSQFTARSARDAQSRWNRYSSPGAIIKIAG